MLHKLHLGKLVNLHVSNDYIIIVKLQGNLKFAHFSTIFMNNAKFSVHHILVNRRVE